MPRVNYSVLLGFIELLDDAGGKSEIARIASREDLNLDSLLPILESGEILGLIEVLEGEVSMTQKAHFFIAASPKVRKKMLRDIIVNIDIFKKIIDLIKQTKDGYLTKDELSRYLSGHQIPFTTDTTEDYTSDFDSFIEWGRQALIFSCDTKDERISLRKYVVGCAHGAAAHKIKDCLNDGGNRHRYYFFFS
jgi:NitT/TauT family transport system ATP-binding protein